MLNIFLGLLGTVSNNSTQPGFKDEFLGHFLGDLSLATYAAALAMAFLGNIISIRLHAEKRDKLATDTPYKFSWGFLLQDNLLRLISGLIMGFVIFRFFPFALGEDLIMLWAAALGLASDNLVYFFEKLQSKARKRLQEISK